MFSQGSLLLLVVVGVVSSLPQPLEWAKLKLFPAVPTPKPPQIVQEIPNVPGETLENTSQIGSPEIPALNPPPIIDEKVTLPLPKEDLNVKTAIIGDAPIIPESGVLGSTEIPGLNPLPTVNAKNSIPVSVGDLSVNVATVGDKSITPELKVPEIPEINNVPSVIPDGLSTVDIADNGVIGDINNLPKVGIPEFPEIPLLNPLPIINATANLPIPKEVLSVTVVVGDKPILPELEVPGSLDIPEPNIPLPTIASINSLPAVDVAENVPNLHYPGVADIPDLNTLPTNNVTGSLPIANGDVAANAVTGDKTSVTELGVPGVSTVAELSSQLSALKHHLSKLEAVLKLEGRIQVVGDKIMATSGKEVDFASSKTACKAVGGQIATPRNEAENRAVLAFVKKYKRYAYLGREGSAPGNFKFLNRVPAVYTRWRKGEPRGQGKENCIEMYTDGQWNSKVCNQKRLTVCEF